MQFTQCMQFTAEEWDACATASGDVSPFLLHAFFAALEASGSASTETGWVPCHIALREGAAAGEPETSGRLRAVVPAYIKAHSYGEYVFDHAWANLHHQLGTPYYPKLQCAVPFTPAPGSRMLIAPGEDEESLRTTMLSALPQIAAALKVRPWSVRGPHTHVVHAWGMHCALACVLCCAPLEEELLDDATKLSSGSRQRSIWVS